MKASHQLIATLCLSALLTACSDDNDEISADAPSESTLTWRSCSEKPEIQCATLSVPMDYSEQDSSMISIGLTRLPARES